MHILPENNNCYDRITNCIPLTPDYFFVAMVPNLLYFVFFTDLYSMIIIHCSLTYYSNKIFLFKIKQKNELYIKLLSRSIVIVWFSFNTIISFTLYFPYAVSKLLTICDILSFSKKKKNCELVIGTYNVPYIFRLCHKMLFDDNISRSLFFRNLRSFLLILYILIF